MAKKPADLSEFQVNVERPLASTLLAKPRAAKPRDKKLVTKGFRITPEAAMQFNILKAEIEDTGNGKDKGPTLIAEALNLLFEKYGKKPIA